MENKSFLFTVLITCLYSLPLIAGWSEPVRLTYREYEIKPKIIAVGDTLHLVWTQIADSEKVSYMRSTNSGITWSNIIDLNSPGHRGSFVNLTENNGNLLARWADYIPFRHGTFAYSISTTGTDWTTPNYINGINNQVGTPVASDICGDSIYVVYFLNDNDSTGNFPFNFLFSSDLGQTWSDEQTIAYAPPSYCNGLTIIKCGGVLYVVWTAIPWPENTTWECQVVYSRDGGIIWQPKIILSENGGGPSQHGCAACNEMNYFFAATWMNDNFPGQFYIRMTRNLGYLWRQPIINITNHSISDPVIFMKADTLLAAWTDWNFDDFWEIGYSKSMDYGLTWSATERISYSPRNSMEPSLASSNGKVHLVWQDDNPNNQGSDIYYSRWEPDYAIKDANKNLDLKMIEAYPNPFNSYVLIKYPKNELGYIYIFNLIGQQVKALSVSRLGGQIVWNASDNNGNSVPSGIYFIRGDTATSTKALRLILIK